MISINTAPLPIIATLWVGALIMRRLCKKGTSPTLRKIILRRHFIYVSLYILKSLWEIVASTLIYYQIYKTSQRELALWMRILNIFGNFGMFAARISEPYVLKIFKNLILGTCRCKRKENASLYDE